MRWLIVGPYPPATDPAAGRTRSFAAERLRGGDDVHVVSPEPSAAHEVADLGGARNLARLLAQGRGFDAVWVHVGGAVGPRPGAGRVRALVDRALLAKALRSLSEVVIDVGDLDRFPGGRAGALVLRSGATFEVGDEDTRAALVERGAPPEMVTVRARHVVPAPPTGASGADDVPAEVAQPVPDPVPDPVPFPSTGDRATLEAWIRARAGTAP